MNMFVRSIDFVSVATILGLSFETVVWYFILYFIWLHTETDNYDDEIYLHLCAI
jgi:hypothetical protein